MIRMSNQPENERSSKKTNQPPDAVETIIGRKRIAEMTGDELIQAMKDIAIELDRRHR
jgi:hypothetical protein